MEFLKNIQQKLENLTELEVKTVVGEMEIDKEGNLNFVKQQKVEAMVSHLSLIGGDNETDVSPKFATEFESLREFHMQKEKQAINIVHTNIEVLEKIAMAAIKFMDGKNYFTKEIEKQNKNNDQN